MGRADTRFRRPSLRDQLGFKGSIWDSADDMVASEASGNYQQQIAKLGSVLAMPPVREAYELTVLD